MFTSSGYHTATTPLVPALGDHAQLFLLNQETAKGSDSSQIDISSPTAAQARTRNLSISTVDSFDSITFMPTIAAENMRVPHAINYPTAEKQYEATINNNLAFGQQIPDYYYALGLHQSQPIFSDLDEEQLNHFQMNPLAITSPTYSSIDELSMNQNSPLPPLISPSTSANTRSTMEDTTPSPYMPFQESVIDCVRLFGLTPFQQQDPIPPDIGTYQRLVNHRNVGTSRGGPVNNNKTLVSSHRGITAVPSRDQSMSALASDTEGRISYKTNKMLDKSKICPICGRKSSRPRDVTRHIETVHKQSKTIHSCNLCGKTFKRKDCVSRHLKRNCAFNREQQ